MKGLSFSEPMVRAWLDGRKTATRRLMNPQPFMDHHWNRLPGYQFHHKMMECADGLYCKFWHYYNRLCDTEQWIKSRYTPGETVYIKETWGLFTILAGHVRENVVYKADDPSNDSQRWRSPMFMPEWASRSHARIVSVRPEQVQKITRTEALLEGMSGGCGPGYDFALFEFKRTWNTLYPGSWERNDWVWRIELEKIEEGI